MPGLNLLGGDSLTVPFSLMFFAWPFALVFLVVFPGLDLVVDDHLIKVVAALPWCNETIGVIKFPEEFGAIGVTMEAYGETIAVLGHENNYLSMWILRDKSSSSTSPWEKKFSIQLQEACHHQVVGFLNNDGDGVFLQLYFFNIAVGRNP